MGPLERQAAPQRSLFLLSEHLQWILAGCIIIAVLCLGNFDLIAGRSAPKFDALEYFGPEFSLVADHIKAGRLLLWDPWVAAGTPDSAEPEFGVTSPVTLAIAWISPNPQAGFVLYWMLIWAIGPLGILVLCRHLKCPPWGGLIAAVGFAASGFYTGHAQHTAHIYSVSLLPWILWRFDLTLLRRSYWCAVQVGAIYGISALGGYPVYTIVTPGFLILWSIGRILENKAANLFSPGWRRQLIFSFTTVILLTATGAVIMSPAYASFLKDTRGYSDRNGPRSRDEALHSNIFPAGDVSTLASPYLSLLDIPSFRFWPFSDISMRSIYLGCEVATLALFAMQQHSKWRWWLFSLAVVFLFCAMGYQMPLRAWLYDYVPPTRYFRNATSFRTYTILLFTILSAMGARDLSVAVEAGDNGGKVRFFISSVTFAILAGWTFAVVLHLSNYPFAGFVHAVSQETVDSLFPFAVAHAFVGWCSLVLLSYWLWQRQLSQTAIYGVLVAIAVFDGVATLYISSPTISSASTVSFWHVMNAQHDSRLDLSSHGIFRQLEPPPALTFGPNSIYHSNKNLPVKVATIFNDITLTNRFYKSMAEDPLLREMALGSNRCWFVSEAGRGLLTNENFSIYVQRVQELKNPVILLHSAEEMLKLSPEVPIRGAQRHASIDPQTLVRASLAQVSQIVYRPNSLSFHYCATKGGWLMVTDRWAPGWKVRVNGKPQEVLGADFVFRAVRVEPGDNFIEFRYRPWGWPYLLILSWGTLLVFGLCQVAIIVKSYQWEDR